MAKPKTRTNFCIRTSLPFTYAITAPQSSPDPAQLRLQSATAMPAKAQPSSRSSSSTKKPTLAQRRGMVVSARTTIKMTAPKQSDPSTTVALLSRPWPSIASDAELLPIFHNCHVLLQLYKALKRDASLSETCATPVSFGELPTTPQHSMFTPLTEENLKRLTPGPRPRYANRQSVVAAEWRVCKREMGLPRGVRGVRLMQTRSRTARCLVEVGGK